MKKKNCLIILSALILFCAAVFVACSLNDSSSSKAEAADVSSATQPPTQSEAELALDKMTLEEKAAQCVMTGISSTYADEDFQRLADEGVGGVILFSDNITDSEQLTELTNQIKKSSGDIPLLIAMDEEGGSVTRLPDDVLSMPSAYSLAMTGDSELVRRSGENLGNQIKSFGVSTGLSPVLDIWSNPNNTVIGERAFGTTADDVCRYGIEELKGIMSSGAIAVAKHFPGHGDTDVDSHYGLPVVTKTKQELEQMEFLPFKEAIKNGVPGIMAAHILCSQIDPDEPASLSKTMITDILKGELGFKGVVFTDDLTMGAISEKYTPDVAAVKALNAGCDMLLVCFGYENAQNTIDAITAAAENNELSKERLDDAVLRILEMKFSYKLDNTPLSAPDIEKMNAATSEFFN